MALVRPMVEERLEWSSRWSIYTLPFDTMDRGIGITTEDGGRSMEYGVRSIRSVIIPWFIIIYLLVL